MFSATLKGKVTKTQKKYFQKRIAPLYIGPGQSFYNFKNCLDQVKLDLNLKSSSLTLDFSGRLSVQYTLHTLYITHKHKKMFQKRIDPLYIGLVKGFYNFFNGFDQNKSDLNLKSSLLTLDFDVKFTLDTLYDTHCTPCTIQSAHLEQYTRHTCTIHTPHLVQYTLHNLYN